TAGSQEWDAPFAGGANCGQRAVHAGVGAAGDTPDAVEGSRLTGGVVVPSGGSSPTQSNGLLKQGGGAVQSARDGSVGRYIGAVIADQSDADGDHGCLLVSMRANPQAELGALHSSDSFGPLISSATRSTRRTPCP